MPKTPENREATVVYPGTSPELMVAYRIFGPGYNDLDAFAEQKKTILVPSCDLTGEGGGGPELTRLGRDLAASMGLDVDEIHSAYKRYKKEIKRMNKADRNLKRKRDQLEGAGADAQDAQPSQSPSPSPSPSDSDSDTSSEETDSSIGNSDEQDQVQDQGIAQSIEGGADEPSPKRNKTIEEHLEIFLDNPDLWVGRDAALAKTKIHAAAIDDMVEAFKPLAEIYATRLPYAKPLAQAMDAAVFNLMRWRDDAAVIERLIEVHDNSRPAAMWVSPDRCGPRVAQALFMFWELNNLVPGMRRSLDHCEYLRRRFLAAGPAALRKRFYHEIVYNLRRFASMCIIEEVRGQFVDELAEERRQWSPESSPCSEEYATDFSDFSSDSESSGEEGEEGEDEEDEEGEDGEDGEDDEAEAADDTAAPTQE